MPHNATRLPEPTERRAQVLRFELTLSTMLAVVLVVAGLWLLGRLLPVVLVLITALFIVGTLSPLVEWLVVRRWRRSVAIALVFTALLIAVVALLALTIPELLAQAQSLVAQEPALRAKVVAFLARSPLTMPLAVWVQKMRFGTWLSNPGALAFSGRLAEGLAYGVGAVFLALYILIDRDRLRGGLFALVPRRHHMRLSRVMMNLETIVGGYIRGQLLTCALLAAFMFILLEACGVPNALALAAFGGVADVLPYIGALLTIVPAVVAALGRGPFIVTIVLVAMLAYEEFESRVLVPVVYGRALRLPSSIVLFSLLVGATLMGIGGALLALPVAAAIQMLIDELRVALPGEPDVAEGDDVHARDDRGEELYEKLTEGMPAAQAAAIAVELAGDRKREESAVPDQPAAPAGDGPAGE